MLIWILFVSSLVVVIQCVARGSLLTRGTSLFMDGGAWFLARHSVYLEPPLFMDATASFLMNVKLQPDAHCQ